MSTFDFENILAFNPPSYVCEKCLAINEPQLIGYRQFVPPICSVCKVKYVPTRDYAPWELYKYLAGEAGKSINILDPIAHGTKLARIARQLRPDVSQQPHLPTFIELLLTAEHFVHFVSWGINQWFIGALKVVSHRVAVRGIVSTGEAWAISELTDYSAESPSFECHTFGGDAFGSGPHQKIIIIDGLVALKGSANLTLNAWRKIQENLEIVEVDTNPESVRVLNNRYFSPLWASRSRWGDSILMAAY